MAERHFLEDAIGAAPTFSAEPWYNPEGDCIIYKMANEASVADRIDELLTIYRSAEDNRPIGFQIKGVNAIIQKFGLVGLAVASQADETRVKHVSIAALLLAAYEDRPFTMSRRLGYAEAMTCELPLHGSTIPLAELQSA
jgi:hypothetical protein